MQECVHPDPGCESGERYSKYAKPEHANACYEPPAATDASTSTSSTSSTTTMPPPTTMEPETSSSSSTSDSSSSSGMPQPVELCNGIDDNDNGLVDEWSPENTGCEICDGSSCRYCDLFPDDEDNPTVVYFFCDGANYNQFVPFCEGIGAPAVSIHDEEENVLLAIKTAELADYARAYLGLRNFGTSADPMWTWVDGTPFDYTNWNATQKQPDDVCANIDTSGSWNSTHCNGGTQFFCEAAL